MPNPENQTIELSEIPPSSDFRIDGADMQRVTVQEPPRIICGVCEHAEPEHTMHAYGAYSHVCEYCRSNNFVNCLTCNEPVMFNDALSLSDGYYCRTCYEDHNTECESCGNIVHENTVDEDGYCVRCNSSSIGYRGFSKAIIGGKTKGTTVSSMRTFGVELECDMNDGNKAGKVSRKIPKTCGVGRDGSVSGNIPVEIVTPPLYGRVGENYLINVCEALKECDTKINRSCGTHIHIGAEDIKDNYEKLKELFMFYLYSEDVIYSFLPKSRWNNKFCRKLCDMYYPDEVEKISSLDRFEHVYYREQDPANKESRKSGKYDTSRYTGVNFHSLMRNYGKTLEIRSHSGTVSAEKILHWVALHTSIIDYVVTNDYTKEKLTEILFSRSKKQSERTQALFDILKLPKKTQDYFLARQKKFLDEFGKNDVTTKNLAYSLDKRYTPEVRVHDISRLGLDDHREEIFRSIERKGNYKLSVVDILAELEKYIQRERDDMMRYKISWKN